MVRTASEGPLDLPLGISQELWRGGWHYSHSALEQSPTRRFSRSGRSQLTLTPHRPKEVTTLSTSSSWPPIYILITFLGKPSRPHSARQAAGKAHRALWQRWRGQACWPAEHQPLGWGISLLGPVWIPQPLLLPAPTHPVSSPTPALLTPTSISSQTLTGLALCRT